MIFSGFRSVPCNSKRPWPQREISSSNHWFSGRVMPIPFQQTTQNLYTKTQPQVHHSPNHYFSPSLSLNKTARKEAAHRKPLPSGFAKLMTSGFNETPWKKMWFLGYMKFQGCIYLYIHITYISPKVIFNASMYTFYIELYTYVTCTESIYIV